MMTAMSNKPPKYIYIGPYRYVISASNKLGEPDDLDGMTDTSRGKIILRKRLSFTRKRETLLHEILHAVWDVCALKNDNEEDMVTRIAPILLDTLRRNLDLVDWLVEE